MTPKYNLLGEFMGIIEDMLVRNGLILRQPDGSVSRIEGSLVTNTMVVRNSSGWVTHRIERSSNGADIIVRNMSTGLVETRIKANIYTY